jgi:hypothetical protein
MKPTPEDLAALKQLGMKVLVMNPNGTAFANAAELIINSDETAWRHPEHIRNPFIWAITVDKLRDYAEDWKESYIVL